MNVSLRMCLKDVFRTNTCNIQVTDKHEEIFAL